MAQPSRPAPVLTIVDPARPGPLHETEPRRPPARLRRGEQLLVVALVLLLVAATTTSRQLRAEHRFARQLRELGLQASLSVAGLTARGLPLLVVQVEVLGDPRADVALDAVGADGGWQLNGSTQRLAHGGSETLTFTHAVTCAHPTAPPRTVRVTARLADGRHRVLVLPVGQELVTLDQAAVCGDLDATRALELSSSTVVREGTRTALVVRFTNRGLDDLRVLAVRFPGFALMPRTALPVVLPGRAPGVLRRTPEHVVPVELVARLTSCALAGQALRERVRRGEPDLLEVLVDGRGGKGSAVVDVQGVLAFLDDDWRSRCVR